MIHTIQVRGRRAAGAALVAVVATSALVAGATADVAMARPGRHHTTSDRTVADTESTFVGANTGAIPDQAVVGSSACGGSGVPGARDVTFAVSGVTAPISDVSVTVTLQHPDGGEVALTLIAPNTVSQPVMWRPTATTPTSCGSSNEWNGTYTFNDRATDDFWAALATGSPAAPGTYRATGTSFINTPVNLTQAFLPLTNPNGTWTLRVEDFGWTGVGTISAALLTITARDVAPCQAATAKTAAARTTLGAARSKATSATAALKKAKTRLKKAVRSGNPTAIKKARARVERATKLKNDAEAAVAAATLALTAAQAGQVLAC